MQKIILFYKFCPIIDPLAVQLWQRTLCGSLGLRGRIIISSHGINGTVGGDLEALKKYVAQTKTYIGFKDTEFKWSDGTSQDFPRLSVKVRDEIVTFGVADEIKVNQSGIVGGGKRLTPRQLHQLIDTHTDDVIFFDGRNSYESAIGKFKGAIVPKVSHSRDFAKELSNPDYDAIKHNPVVTYCTGGIRCEVLSMLMKKQGFTDVYQLDGGIAKYGETYKDDGYWEGSLYVFDERMKLKFSDKAADIGKCVHCQAKTSNYENCSVKQCNKLILVCAVCRQAAQLNCSKCRSGQAIKFVSTGE